MFADGPAPPGEAVANGDHIKREELNGDDDDDEEDDEDGDNNNNHNQRTGSCEASDIELPEAASAAVDSSPVALTLPHVGDYQRQCDRFAQLRMHYPGSAATEDVGQQPPHSHHQRASGAYE